MGNETAGRRERQRLNAARAGMAAALALLVSPGFVTEARAFEIFGIRLFGSDEETVEVIDPVRYAARLESSADPDLHKRLETASSLIADQKQPVSGDLGVVVKAREDRDRLIATLYEEARYGATVTIAVAGTDIDDLPPVPAFNHAAPVPVVIRIDPGPLFRLGSIRFAGDAAGRDPRAYDLAPGEKAGSLAIIKAGEKLLLDLKAEGRPLARLTERQVTADHDSRSVDVVITAEAGPVADLGAVTVKGSRKIDADFVTRYSRLDRGSRYSPEELRKAAERLRALGVFSSVTIREAEKLAPDGTLPLTIEISEGKHRYFGFGADYASIDGAGLQGYWGHRNLFGRAEALRIEGKVSGIGGDADLSRLNYAAGVVFTKPGAFVPQATFETRLDAKLEHPDAYKAQTLIWSASIAYELNDRDKLKGGIEAAIERSEDAFGENDYATLSLPLAFERDARDNKLDPASGYHATLSAKPSYELINSGVFSSFEGSIAGYLGLGEEDRVVLAGKLAAGTLIASDGLDGIPATRRFFAGGGGSVRGYGYREISPRNDSDDATGGLSYATGSFEARIKLSETIGIVPFVDVGTVSARAAPDFSDIRAGAGIGVRYATPFGPLRLDVAVPLQRYSGGSRYGIYAGIGQAF